MTPQDDDSNLTEARPRGRPRTGASRAEVLRKAAKKHREKIALTKSSMRIEVDPATKSRLEELKGELKLSTIGEVIDWLAKK